MKQFLTLVLFSFFLIGNNFSQVIITQVGDPSDNASCRFLELYNVGSSQIDLSQVDLRRYANGSTSSTNRRLEGTLCPGEFYVIAVDAAAFNTCFGFAPDLELTIITSNGDDDYQLYDVQAGASIDVFGIIGVDLTATCLDHEDGYADRQSTATTPDPDGDNEADWIIYNDDGNATDPTGCTDYNSSPTAGMGAMNVVHFTGSAAPGVWSGSTTPSCAINYLILSQTSCSGTDATVSLDVNVCEPATTFTLTVSPDPGSLSGTYNHADLPISLAGFSGDNSTTYNLTVDYGGGCTAMESFVISCPMASVSFVSSRFDTNQNGSYVADGDRDAAAALDDAWETSEGAPCAAQSGTFDATYGLMTFDDATGTGTVTGLVETNTGTDSQTGDMYAGTVTYTLRTVGSFPYGDIDETGSSAVGISDDLQGAPAPESSFPRFSSTGNLNLTSQILIELSVPVNNLTFWIGDIETTYSCGGTNYPATLKLFNADDVLIQEEIIPTLTPDQSLCTGSTHNGTGYLGCGNTETHFVNITSSQADISKVLLTVGDFCNGSSLSEHLSFGGVSLGGTCSVVLPVELNFFEAEKRDESSLLTWQTASEENNDYFIIEHSLDGRNFSEIGMVNGSGNSLEIIDYSFIHETPSYGINYYRLTQVDFDGTTVSTKIRTVSFGRKQAFSLQPTIASDELNVIFENTLELDADFMIVDIAGAIINQGRFTEGSQNETINVSNLSKGAYFFIITDNQERLIERFIKR